MSILKKVFVYGTLREGNGNHGHYLSNSQKLGDYVLPPKYTMISLGGFPGVIQGGDTPITGEVYEVTEETFRALDRLEGYPNFYNRMEVQTPYGEAMMYFLEDTRHAARKIESGDWNQYSNR